MKITQTVDCYTSDTEPIIEIAQLTGVKKPFAYFLNYNSHGYGIFKIDPKSLLAFEKNLSALNDSCSRK